MNKRLFLVVNEDRFFLSHRKEIALRARQEGYYVTIVCKDTGQMTEVEALGFKVLNLPIDPTGENIIQELKTFCFLYKLYRNNKDAIVHQVGLKIILWGGLAARLAKVHGVVNAVSGLGTLFNGEKPSLTARCVMFVMRLSNHRKKVATIFQNHEDESLFFKYKVVSPNSSIFIKGSGVDLIDFPFTPMSSEEKVHVIFTARMVREKGTLILIEAAEKLRNEYEGKVDFWLCGGLSTNPNALKEDDLCLRCDGSYIQWLGHRKDVKDLLKRASIVAFPSYYREGVPKSLIEATAIGRPIITCNSIGCKDTVDDGVNGFLIPVRDSDTLAEKLKILIEDKDLREKMGEASRRKAEKEFSLDMVIEKHLEVYLSLV